MYGWSNRAVMVISRRNRSGPSAGELGVEHFQRDLAVMLQVAGEVDRGHAPATELSLERIRIRQSLGERLLGRGH